MSLNIKKYFDIHITPDDEKEIVASVEKGIVFKGLNLWVLVFAIFIASLGLNVNSTAVIIGAMLISPLMGPIIGMGVAVGISDFDLLKRAFKNYAVTAIVSVITATLYFLLSPISDAQSELLARTTPNIYDVLIALFGGLAGVVAICARERGNVIPGVAIATALMPPLCTAGYGVSQGEWSYFFGAFYLFFINSVFISLATYIGVRFFQFQRHTYVNAARGKKLTRYITLIVVLTIIPATFTTVNIVRESIFLDKANKFINSELSFEGTQVIQRDISFDKHNIRVVLVGQEVSSQLLDVARQRMADYHLGETSLSIIQGANRDSLDINSLRRAVAGDLLEREEQTIKRQKRQMEEMQTTLAVYERYDNLSGKLRGELKTLFPTIESISVSHAVRSYIATDSIVDTICLVRISYSDTPLRTAERQKLIDWLKARIGTEKLEIAE